ncbi:hypothetical protein CN109_27370, partial [Sinorhizobium meliloti]
MAARCGRRPHLNLCPQAHAASPFSPPAGSRCRQADEGAASAPSTAIHLGSDVNLIQQHLRVTAAL